MKMIVGLGNIGLQYERTRHNTGFIVVDNFVTRHDLHFKHSSMRANVADGLIEGQKVLVVKPTTYMNDSGWAVGPLMDYYDVPLDDLIVVHDEMDLPIGKIRLRAKGSAGGHNGIKSIIEHLGTRDFARLRVGIEHPTRQRVVDYVLGRFTKDQQAAFNKGVTQANEVLDQWITGVSFDTLMNEFN